jgi:hypothetical protein
MRPRTSVVRAETAKTKRLERIGCLNPMQAF